MKSVAVVLLNFNGSALLKEFLPLTIQYSGHAKVVVIDNGSTDDSVIWVKKHFPEVACIELGSNYGYAEGYNRGLKRVQADYYALVNTDVKLTPDWLSPLLNRLETHAQTVAVQPHLLDLNRPTYFEYAGAAGGYIDSLGIPFCRGRIFGCCEQDRGQYNTTVPIFWASGACFVIRSNTFWEFNGFDPHFFAHQEEIDLCWRIFNAGYTVEAVGESKVFHIGAATLPLSPHKIFLNHRNSLLMCAKNVPRNKLLIVLLVRLVLDGLVGFSYLLKIRFKATFAIVRAHFSFYKTLNSSRFSRTKEIKRSNYFLRKSILIDFFLFRRLNFKDLNNNYK